MLLRMCKVAPVLEICLFGEPRLLIAALGVSRRKNRRLLLPGREKDDATRENLLAFFWLTMNATAATGFCGP